MNENETRRKFYREDFEKFFLTKYLDNSIVAPKLAPILEPYDITTDPEFSFERIQRNLERYAPYLDRGQAEDRRIYISFISAEYGYGAFADVFIPEWTLIGEYTGIISIAGEHTDYAWIYHSKPLDSEGNKLKLRVDARTCGSLVRFVNHSEEANCNAIHVPYKNKWRTLYVSNTNIMPGQQLTVNYGESFWKERGKA